MKKEMLINVKQPEECRIAIVEDGILEELYVERTSHESYTGNIYKGRIVNLEPAIQAAFVDFSVGRNGFLHVSDVESQYFDRGPMGPPEADAAPRDRDRRRDPRREGDRDRNRGRDPRRRPPRPTPLSHRLARHPWNHPESTIDISNGRGNRNAIVTGIVIATAIARVTESAPTSRSRAVAIAPSRRRDASVRA